MPNDTDPPAAVADAANITMNTLLEQTTALNGLSDSLKLQGAISSIPTFDGHTIALRDYCLDLRNRSHNIKVGDMERFTRVALTRLQGAARNCTVAETIVAVDQLIDALKQRFAPGRDYAYYNDKIQELRMKRGESVGGFYDRMRGLLNNAEAALKGDMTNAEFEIIRRPVREIALKMFIKRLPVEISRALYIQPPGSLVEAYQEAVRLEGLMDNGSYQDQRYRDSYTPQRQDRTPPRNYYPRYDGGDRRGYRHDDRRDAPRDSYNRSSRESWDRSPRNDWGYRGLRDRRQVDLVREEPRKYHNNFRSSRNDEGYRGPPNRGRYSNSPNNYSPEPRYNNNPRLYYPNNQTRGYNEQTGQYRPFPRNNVGNQGWSRAPDDVRRHVSWRDNNEQNNSRNYNGNSNYRPSFNQNVPPRDSYNDRGLLNSTGARTKDYRSGPNPQELVGRNYPSGAPNQANSSQAMGRRSTSTPPHRVMITRPGPVSNTPLTEEVMTRMK